MGEKGRIFYANWRKETPDRYKMELENYEKNRSIDENLHKALDGLYCREKVSAGYAFILKCNLILDWKEPITLENAKQAYKDRKKYK